MKALVTGGAGFLGLYITEQLVARGDQVRVLSRGHYPVLDELGVELIQGDLRDANTVDRACAGQDAVFHVAAVPGVWGTWQHFHSINTQGTLNIIESCRQAGVSKLIHTSSPSVIYDGQPHENANESLPYPSKYLCHYPHTKALGEQAVLAANGIDNLWTTSLRPHLIWGRRDNHLLPRLIARAKSGRLRRVGDGNNLISMAYVENVAAAHLQAADKLNPGSPVGGEAYFINEPAPVKLWAWIDQLLDFAGLPPVRRSISAKAAWRVGSALETVYRALRISAEPPMTRFVASQLSESHYYDISKAERDFDYRPLVTVEEGMRRTQPLLENLGKTGSR